MKTAIKVNADYEADLSGRPQPQLNEALEFLAFFLDDRPIYTQKKYSNKYLEHVARLVGRKPETVTSGPGENWWGKLLNRENELRLNSKVECSNFLKENNFVSEIFVLKSVDELKLLKKDDWYILKADLGMSGQGNSTYQGHSEIDTWIKKTLQLGPIVAEPLRNRSWDFSSYVISSSQTVHYQNLVDHNFQYKGTVFTDIHRPNLEQLSFYSKTSAAKWKKFQEVSTAVIAHYHQLAGDYGFCLDSFIYDDQIRPVCEVNYRRTMGLTAFQLGKKFAQGPWVMLFLSKSSKRGFLDFKIPGVTVLSPGDTRFEMFLIEAKDENEGRERLKQLEKLLPEGKLAVEF